MTDSTMTDEMGHYMFKSLSAGEYRITNTMMEPLWNVMLKGGATHDRSLAWNGMWEHNFPYTFSHQKIESKVMIGSTEVADWPVCVFDTESNAADYVAKGGVCSKAKGLLDRQMTGKSGMAALRFPRASDDSPGKGGDMVAFVVPEASHSKDAAFELNLGTNRIVEVAWFSKDSVAAYVPMTKVLYNKAFVSAKFTLGGKPANGWRAYLHQSDFAGAHKTTDKNAGAVTRTGGDGKAFAGKDGMVTWNLNPTTSKRPVWATVAPDDVTSVMLSDTALGSRPAQVRKASDVNPNGWTQTGNDGVGLSANGMCKHPELGANACEDNDFTVGSITAGMGAAAKSTGDKKNMYLKYTWDRTVPPAAYGKPDTVYLGEIEIAWTELDVVVPIHRELDDMPGATAMDDRSSYPNTGVYVTSKSKATDAKAYTDAKSHARWTDSKYAGGSGIHSLDNVPVGMLSIKATPNICAASTYPPQQCPPATYGDTAAVMVLGDDSLHYELDGMMHYSPVMVVDNASMANKAAGTMASAFAYKRTDSEISGMVKSDGTDPVMIDNILVSLYDMNNMMVDSTRTKGGAYSFKNVADGMYKVMIPGGTVPGAKVGGVNATWESMDRLGPVGKTGGTAANGEAGTSWDWNAKTKRFRLMNVCNDDFTTATRRVGRSTGYYATRGDGMHTMTAASKSSANFMMTRMNTVIRGLIHNDRPSDDTDEFGTPIPESLGNATVSIYKAVMSKGKWAKVGDMVASGTTNAMGKYTFTVQEGTYWLEASHDDHYVSPKQRIVTTGPGADAALVNGHLATLDLPSWRYSKNAPWSDADGNIIPGGEGAGSFTWLRNDGEVRVLVTEAKGTGQIPLAGATVVLYRCGEVAGGNGGWADNPVFGQNGKTLSDRRQAAPGLEECILHKNTAGAVVPITANVADDEAGVHVFNNVREGVYRVNVTHNTHQTMKDEVVVKGAEAPEVSMRMKLDPIG